MSIIWSLHCCHCTHSEVRCEWTALLLPFVVDSTSLIGTPCLAGDTGCVSAAGNTRLLEALLTIVVLLTVLQFSDEDTIDRIVYKPSNCVI